MSFAEAVKNPSSTMGAPQTSQYTNVRTLICTAINPETNDKIEHIMKELVDHDLGPSVVQRVTKMQPRGEFALTMENTITRNKVKEIIEEAIKDGSFHYTTKKDNDSTDEQYVILTGFPEEMRIDCINTYMTQYLYEPKAEILKHPDFGFEIGELKICHKGLRKPLDKRVWIGPNISAYIKEASVAPWDSCVPVCSNCFDHGHLYYTCDRPQKCRLCRKVGHLTKECEKCKCCKKWGHNENICFFNPENKRSSTKKVNDQIQQKITIQESIKKRVQAIMNKKTTKNTNTPKIDEEVTDEEESTITEDEDEDTIVESTTDSETNEKSEDETGNETENDDNNGDSETDEKSEDETKNETDNDDNDGGNNIDTTEGGNMDMDIEEILNKTPTRERGIKRGAKESPKHGKEKKNKEQKKDNKETNSKKKEDNTDF